MVVWTCFNKTKLIKICLNASEFLQVEWINCINPCMLTLPLLVYDYIKTYFLCTYYRVVLFLFILIVLGPRYMPRYMP